ncbi:38934_t:CDS:2 [Gigaspora margarita]|uniref:38934_t:CDS:1 n=1 Tax=Gigaspora margarita TaxID=4874 RepID=A0ABN7V8A7_GIGMA|nr:38934_t:CDS:2 [Gigaspora margarita]
MINRRFTVFIIILLCTISFGITSAFQINQDVINDVLLKRQTSPDMPNMPDTSNSMPSMSDTSSSTPDTSSSTPSMPDTSSSTPSMPTPAPALPGTQLVMTLVVGPTAASSLLAICAISIIGGGITRMFSRKERRYGGGS